MTTRKISLLLSDVDGSLVTTEKVLTARARNAVLRLREKNILFAITSGRPPRGMSMFVDPLGLAQPIAGFNGGAYVEPNLRLLESHVLSADVAKRAVECALQHGLDAWLYTGDDWYLRNPEAPHVAREAWTVAFAARVVDNFDSLYASAVKVVGISDDAGRMRAANDALQHLLGDAASVSLSQPYYVDITNPVANKAAVVRYHAARLGIPQEEIATIGDMPNDVLMFRDSGFSIAMGNASDDVKKQASAVTDSCNDEGFAKAVERYLLA
ncbi:MAG TPA: HAD family hydrolase [Rhizomicrobium sp.]|nr:HAD family hydrolase [Rhizomicrobium sp.]